VCSEDQSRAVEVVAQRGINRLGGCQLLLLHPESSQDDQGKDGEMAAAHAGSRTRMSFAVLGQPSKVPAAGRQVFVASSCTKRRYIHETAGRPSLPGRATARRASSSLLAMSGPVSLSTRRRGVVEQELHHVVLGEELRDSGQFIGPDLLPRGIDLVLPLRLPELIGPA